MFIAELSFFCCPCSEDNWPFFLKLHIEWRCEYLKEKWNPFTGDKEYKDLTIRQRVEILHKLCHWRLELDDIADLVRVSQRFILNILLSTLSSIVILFEVIASYIAIHKMLEHTNKNHISLSSSPFVQICINITHIKMSLTVFNFSCYIFLGYTTHFMLFCCILTALGSGWP